MKENNRKSTIVVISIVLIILSILCIFAIVNNAKKNSGNNEQATIKVYEELIDVLASQTQNFAGDNKYISLDTDKLVNLSDGELMSSSGKEEILEYLKKYNETVYDMNAEEIISKDLGSNQDLGGYVLKINVVSVNKNKATVNIGHNRANLSSLWLKYYLTFNNGKWDYKDSGEYVMS